MRPGLRTPSLTPRSRYGAFRRARQGLFGGLLAVLVASACAQEKIIPPPPVDPEEIVGWRALGTWSGEANIFTETITSDSAAFRVHWQAKPQQPSPSPVVSLSVIFRSGDSGNPIINAVNTSSPGEGVVNVAAERPRWYYLDIQSTGASWTVRVEEPIYGSRRAGRPGTP